MDFDKVFKDYYDNHKHQEIIKIYEKNKNEIIEDGNLMDCVISSYIGLRRYIEANSLVNERLSVFIASLRIRDLTEDEEDELDLLLEFKIAILRETKSYFKLLVLLNKYGGWLENENLELGMYKKAANQIYKQLFYILVIVLIMSGTGLYIASVGVINASFMPIFRFLNWSFIGLYFLIGFVIRYFQPRLREE